MTTSSADPATWSDDDWRCVKKCRGIMRFVVYVATILTPAYSIGDAGCETDSSRLSSPQRPSESAAADWNQHTYLVADHVRPSSPLRVQGYRFIDPEGRQVLLHGMNIVSKSKRENYLSWHRPEDFANMRAWGMNCIRLGLIWDGVEPEPGRYDETYLNGVQQRIEWAAENGLYVFLDMHQDLFSVLYSDGAPPWATLHENKPHKKGEIWSDSYVISPAVQTAFDNFWSNSPAPDGIGIQDHYAAAWRHIAKRFASNSTVIGYDIMNEPFQGSAVVDLQTDLMGSEFGETLARRLGNLIGTRAEIATLWQQPDGRRSIMAQLEDIQLYEAFVRAQEDLSQTFERQQLQPMYQRVANAIREVDSDHILLLEASYHCNAGVYSAIQPVTGPDGSRDPRQAYVPHAYDIVVDTPQLVDANAKRVELIFRHHNQTAERLAMPLLIGEWGAFGGADQRILPSARILQRQLELLRCGDTYWDYGKAIEKKPYFGVLKRSIPSRIAGTLLEYKSDPEASGFSCRWRETAGSTAPTILYLTAETLEERDIRLKPRGEGYEVQSASSGSSDVYVSIPPTGEAGERLLSVE